MPATSVTPRPSGLAQRAPAILGLALLFVGALVTISLVGTLPANATLAAGSPPTQATPVYAYFYQWFTPTSWNRAKIDYPLAGRYSSDDPTVLDRQIQQAKAAGIDGFLTSWKSTPTLNSRLQLLLTAARRESFDVGVVYQSLDFSRQPLPVTTVAHDMNLLISQYGSQLSSAFGRPLIIWTGTDLYSMADVWTVRHVVGGRALLLAASKSSDGYQRVAPAVDGEAYYWSSADPTSPGTIAKLQAMSAAVHSDGGIWIAPAAPGYDGTTLGGTRVIDRQDGQTFRDSLQNAYASSPDAVGIISWNEWSENTYIEPGQRYGDQELAVLRDYLHLPPDAPDTNAVPQSRAMTWTATHATAALAASTLAAGLWLLYLGNRRRRASDDHQASAQRHSSTPW